MTIAVHAHFDSDTNTVSYVVIDQDTNRAAIIDPVLGYRSNSATIDTVIADRLLTMVERERATLDYVLETHAHADHLTAAHYIRAKAGAKVVIGKYIQDVQQIFAPIFGTSSEAMDDVFDVLMDEGNSLALGHSTIRAMHTPGHTPACLTYLVDDAAFVGDTLFMPDYGTARADFPGGNAATLYRSIRKILALPPATRIFVGHDYLPESRKDYAWETTVAEQRRSNVHVSDRVEEATFVAMRDARDATLDQPRLILPALQVNIHGGKLPGADGNGHVFLKIPLNVLGDAARLPPGLF